MRFPFLTCALLSACVALRGQVSHDTLPPTRLPEITVVGQRSSRDIQQLPEIVGTTVYAGKKNALIVVANVQGNAVTNTMRQVMAKVPGIHVWESDGSGIQIGIAARGLSPNRSWEFNVRQNGYDIAADPFGYPEAYYNPQLQSVQRIEVVRGHGALQYGPQFGGLVNYILKNGSDITRPVQVETEQTVGSFGLFNSYNAVGGTVGKVHYYAFFDHLNAEGWRANARYRSDAGFGSVTWKPTAKLALTAEYMRWGMLSQQPGGLADAQFLSDARQSARSRNWFNLDWQTAALIADYAFSATNRLNVKLFAIGGDRNSIGFMPGGGIVVADTLNAATRQFNPRNLDIDQYRNAGMEARYIADYALLGAQHTLSSGLRLYAGNTRRNRGTGSTGTDLDLTLAAERWNTEIEYGSQNAAAFVENVFRLGKVLLIPGIRYEYLTAEAGGYNGLTAGQPNTLQPQRRGRGFVLAGIGGEWHATRTTELYANISQAYRPVQFADLTTPPTTDRIDPALTDAQGFNADLGYRGQLADYLIFDISLYHLQYNNRVGTLKQQDPDGSFYNLRTNVGHSTARGVEALADINWGRALGAPKDAPWGEVSTFAAYSFCDARYGNFKVITLSGNTLQEKNYDNNRVENAPQHILRTGATYALRGAALTAQCSHVGSTFADANNTEAPTANGQNGLIPAYTVWDLTASYRHAKGLTLKAGINNLTDARYFTRRAGGYPGPGLLPADGRSFFVSIGGRF